MARYVVQLDLTLVAGHLSKSFGCDVSAADVREILLRAGLVESSAGWLATDLRPLTLLYGMAGRLFG